MRTHAKNLKSFVIQVLLSWLMGAATVTIYLSRFAVEDFFIGDLVPFFLILLVFGTLLSLGVALALRFISKRINSFFQWLSLPLISAVLMTAPVTIFLGLRTFILESFPVVESVLFFAAFFMQGFAFGLVFLWFHGSRLFRRWLPTMSYAVATVGLAAFVPNFIPPVSEALISSRDHGEVVRSVLLSEPRSGHTATLLKDGRILLTGGMVSVVGQELPTASAEIYDPRTNTLAGAAKMSVARAGHTATLLDDGDVLITGGVDERQVTESVELYRAAVGDFVTVAPMQLARERHSATLLKNGAVLITGGSIVQPSNEVEIYNPETRTFRSTGPMNAKRAAQTSTLLPDGQVLITGGAESLNSVLASVEIFDPKSESFKFAGKMQARRYKHSAVLLSNGMVLVLGGADERDWSGRRNSVEIYDPLENRSQIAGNMNRARFKFPNAVVRLSTGEVVVGGGGRRVEIFDGSRGEFRVSAGSLEDEWFYSTATPLPDGRVFIAGGYNSHLTPTTRTWLYQPGKSSRN